MKRHSIIVRLGPADKAAVTPYEADSVVTTIRLVDGQRQLGFALGDLIDRLGTRGIYPSETAIDLLIVAAAVTAADTRISRATESQDAWTREIDLYIPVERPDHWSAATALLQRILRFLTGDEWRVFFRPRHTGHKQLIDRPVGLVGASFDSVCLFSGGLDSFVGAIDLLAARNNPIFVSHYWDNSTSKQELCAARIAKVYGDMEPRHVRARIGFATDLVKGSDPEKTTRGRSFLFLAMAALAASALDGTPAIYVPENGLISLNVPLDALRLGAWSTRTTHPFYLARWQDLLDNLGIAAHLDNPYRFNTKGEMLTNCRNKTLLEKSLADTISCSSTTKARWQRKTLGHCGHCLPCLIRRAAIKVAFTDDPTTYTLPDLSAKPLKAKSAEAEHVRSFQLMGLRLAGHPNLAKVLVHKPGPLSDYGPGDIAKYADVFKRGIEEVGELVRGVVVKP